MTITAVEITAIAALITGLGSLILGILNYINNRKKAPAEVGEIHGKTQKLEEEAAALQVERIKNLNQESIIQKKEHSKEVAEYKEEIKELRGCVEVLETDMMIQKRINRSYRDYIDKCLTGIYILVDQIRKKGDTPDWLPPDPPPSC